MESNPNVIHFIPLHKNGTINFRKKFLIPMLTHIIFQ